MKVRKNIGTGEVVEFSPCGWMNEDAADALPADRLRPFEKGMYATGQIHHRGGETPCAHCGKPIKHGNEKFDVEVVDGGADYMRPQMNAEAMRDDAGYMAFFPVGSDCARLLRADGVIVTPRVRK